MESPCVLGTCGGPRHVRLPSSTQVSPRRLSEVSVTSTALLFTPPCGSLHGPARGRESSRPPALRVASDRRGRLVTSSAVSATWRVRERQFSIGRAWREVRAVTYERSEPRELNQVLSTGCSPSALLGDTDNPKRDTSPRLVRGLRESPREVLPATGGLPGTTRLSAVSLPRAGVSGRPRETAGFAEEENGRWGWAVPHLSARSQAAGGQGPARPRPRVPTAPGPGPSTGMRG